ncbi:glycosyltransferase family 39 protein [Alteromonas pelagimontana]|uniref:Glycosyltransferase family 39 protein n=1 Tax=Alteromonas pelagimontana TaxID=1858656 RepID=A0A6M4ME75_9ALTE|nr:glycosyltransferase family 39 protein [Alteromonas pelagimontana]QJR81484.1 glycosyltransferase family 39 protein [Alteromonas pelagimontana]
MNIFDNKKQLYDVYTISLFTLAIGLIFLGLGLRDPWPADEPRFAQIAKEMVETGNWFFPTRAGEYYPDKPPVFMWAIAFFFVLTGSIKMAFLLPSALSALLTLFLVYDLGKRFWGRKEALVATATLLFCLQFLLQAKSAQIDAMVTCWITISCYGLLRFLLLERRWCWYYLAFFFMGIGVITKGVGFLPVFMLIPYYFYQKIHLQTGNQEKESYVVVRWLAGPIIMLVAIALWFLPMLLMVHYSQDVALIHYRDNILFKQTVTRYADSWHHIKPFWYYIVEVIPVFWLPVSLALPWLIPYWYRAIKERDGRIILPLAWIVLLVFFFSLSPGKRGVYVFPALPMLALICAPYFITLARRRHFTWLLWSLVFILSSALLFLGVAGIAKADFAMKLGNKFTISPWLLFFTIGMLGVIITTFTIRQRRWLVWPLFISMLWGGYSIWGYTLLNEIKTPKTIFQKIDAVVGEQEATIALVDFSEQFVLFSPYPVVHFGYHTASDSQIRAAYAWLKDVSTDRYVLIDESHLTDICFDQSKVIQVGYAHRTNWVLLSGKAMKAVCPLPDKDIETFMYRSH